MSDSNAPKRPGKVSKLWHRATGSKLKDSTVVHTTTLRPKAGTATAAEDQSETSIVSDGGARVSKIVNEGAHQGLTSRNSTGVDRSIDELHGTNASVATNETPETSTDAETTHTAVSTEINPTVQLSSPSISIYQEALEQLPEDTRDLLVQHGADLSECIEHAELIRSTCYKAKIRWQFHGKTISLKDQTDKLLTIFSALKPVGDYVAGLDAAHFALPWAGVKLILDVALKNREQREALVQGMESCVECKKRLGVYEATLKTTTQAAKNVRESLLKLNVRLLTFLAIAIRACKNNALVRVAQPWWVMPQIEEFDKQCEQDLDAIARDASSFNHELVTNAFANLSVKLDSVAERIDLKELKAAVVMEAIYEGEGCLEGTRVDLLATIKAWAAGNDRTFWLQGKAGTGKSTISRSVIEQTSGQGLVVACFFFSKTATRQQEARYVWPTIAEQLLAQLPSIRPHLAEVLRQNPLISSKSPEKQYLELIEKPLIACNMPLSNICLIIDAMDECDASFKALRKTLESTQLRLFMTSRPEVTMAIATFSIDRVDPLHDIELFIREELDVDDSSVQALASKTTPSFIIASTLCKYINEGRAKDKIEKLLRSQAIADLVAFYADILNDIGRRLSKQGREDFITDFHAIIGPLSILAEPLTADTLAELLGVSRSRVMSVIQRLQSVLNIEGTITPHHITFYECIKQGEGEFVIDVDKTQEALGQACLYLLDKSLRPMTSGNVPKAISYANHYWVGHMWNTLLTQPDIVAKFLTTRFLSWTEAMAWDGDLQFALQTLDRLVLLTSGESTQLTELVQDCQKFLKQNVFVLEQDPSQVYLSSLLFVPRDSTISKHFRPVLDDNPYFGILPDGPLEWQKSSWTIPYRAELMTVNPQHTQVAIVSQGWLSVLNINSGQTLVQLSNPSTLDGRKSFLALTSDFLILLIDDRHGEVILHTWTTRDWTYATRDFWGGGSIVKTSFDLSYAISYFQGNHFIQDLFGERLALPTDSWGVSAAHMAVGSVFTAIFVKSRGVETCRGVVRLFRNSTARLHSTISAVDHEPGGLIISRDSTWLAVLEHDSDKIRFVSMETSNVIFTVSLNSSWSDLNSFNDEIRTFYHDSLQLHATDDILFLSSVKRKSMLAVIVSTQTTIRTFLPGDRNLVDTRDLLMLPIDLERCLCSGQSGNQYTGIVAYYETIATSVWPIDAVLTDSETKQFLPTHFTVICSSGTLLAIAAEAEFSVWLSDLTVLAKIDAGHSWQSICISSGDEYVAAVGRNSDGEYEITLLNTSSLEIKYIPCNEADVEFSPLGCRLIYKADHRYQMRDVKTDEVLMTWPYETVAHFWADGILVVQSYRDYMHWDTIRLQDWEGTELSEVTRSPDEGIVTDHEGVRTVQFEDRAVQLTASMPARNTSLVLKDGWICYLNHRLLWIPTAYRMAAGRTACRTIGKSILILRSPTEGMWFQLRDNIDTVLHNQSRRAKSTPLTK